MIKIILILCICTCGLSEKETPIFLSKCQSYENGSKNDSTLWYLLKPQGFQNYFILVGGSLAIIGLIPTIVTWKFYKSLSIPSDIMLAICFAQLLSNIAMLISTSYTMVNQSIEQQHKLIVTPQNFNAVCTGIGAMYALGDISSLLYNTVFCVILTLSMGKTLKGTGVIFNPFVYHFFVVFIAIALTITLGLTNSLGLSIGGICSYQSKQQFARVVVQMIIVLICSFSMYVFGAKIPKNSYFKKVPVFKYYYYYMGFYSFIQVLGTVGYLAPFIACQATKQTTDNQQITLYSISNTFISVTNTFAICLQILLSFAVIFLRFSHPVIKLKISNVLKPTYEIKLDDDEKKDQEGDQLKYPWLGSLLQSIKGSQIISFLSAVLLSFAEQENKIQKQSAITKFSFAKNYIFRLNQSMADEYFLKCISNRETIIQKQKLDGLCSLDFRVTSYAIEAFALLLSKEKKVNIFNSFNINLNINLVKLQSFIRGGKSGQFFFVTHDYKFIIKTVSIDQAHLYKHKVGEFYQYFKQNPSTLITKIFGLYKFKRTDIKEDSIYLILMKNISPYDRKNQLRVYDIKGSQFNRSTLEEENIVIEEIEDNEKKLQFHTLKDVDFKKLQKKIHIEPEQSALLKEQLKKDTEFLMKMQVMDYSILLIKRKGIKRDKNYQFSKFQLTELPSTEGADIYYNIGIIDYLQSWTLKRKAERAFKSIITKKKITVASPEEYSQRLSRMLDQII